MLFLIANPTPASLRSSCLRPLQKKVYPDPISLSWPSSANLVSLRAHIWMLYLDSSFATSAVLLMGLFAAALSMRVLTFQAPTCRGIRVLDCLSLFLVPHVGFSADSGLPARRV